MQHRDPAPETRISALGGLSVRRGDTVVAELPSQPVRCAVLVYLAAERRATRDELIALCWPDRSTTRARRSLSQVLYELRGQLGTDWVSAAGEQIETTALVTMDVLDFEAAVAAGRDAEALATYAGPFLDGVHLAGSTSFEMWMERRRTQLARMFHACCRRACSARQQAGDFAGALAVAHQWTHHDPLDDEAHHHLVRLLVSANRRAEAVRCHDDFTNRLQRELGVLPLEETQQLIAAVRDDAEPAAITAAPPPAAMLPPAAPPRALPPAQPNAKAHGQPRTAPDTALSARRRRMAASLAVMLSLGGAAYVGARGSAGDGMGLTSRVEARSSAATAADDLVRLGETYLDRPGEGDVRKFEPAMRHFREALQLAPGHARAHAALSRAYRGHVGLPLPVRRDSAYEYARTAAELDPSLPEARSALGWAQLLRGAPDLAAAELDRALALDAGHADALTARARLAWLRGRPDDAVRWQRRALERTPLEPSQHAWLGSYLLDLGALDDADRAYGRAAELAPDAPAPAYMLAQIALIRGRGPVADSAIARLLDAASGHPGAEFVAGRYHAQRGRLDLAAASLELAADRLAGAVATTSLQRAWLALRQERAGAAAGLLDLAERDLRALESAGFRAPRMRIQLAALRGDAVAAVDELRRWWPNGMGGDMTAGPQLGIYYVDADPLLERIRHDSEFRALLAQIRRDLDMLRAGLGRADVPD